VFDILVAHAGMRDDEHGDNRLSFVYNQTAEVCREYRFCGSLGFGGKFYNEARGWTVGCYREDETPARLAAIAATNAALAALATGGRS
jgi:hypothetical protein